MSAKVYHAHLWGTRKQKYGELLKHNVSTTDWEELEPEGPPRLFVPQNRELLAEYEDGVSVSDILSDNLLGFQTHRGGVAVAFDEEALLAQVTGHMGREPEQKLWARYSQVVDYRPFDTRRAYLSIDVCDRPRLEVTEHLFSENVGLERGRQGRLPREPKRRSHERGGKPT